jgi:hypothetical protein
MGSPPPPPEVPPVPAAPPPPNPSATIMVSPAASKQGRSRQTAGTAGYTSRTSTKGKRSLTIPRPSAASSGGSQSGVNM